MLILALGDHVKRVLAGREAVQVKRRLAWPRADRCRQRGIGHELQGLREVHAYGLGRLLRLAAQLAQLLGPVPGARVLQDVLGLLAAVAQSPPGDVGQPEVSALRTGVGGAVEERPEVSAGLAGPEGAVFHALRADRVGEGIRAPDGRAYVQAPAVFRRAADDIERERGRDSADTLRVERVDSAAELAPGALGIAVQVGPGGRAEARALVPQDDLGEERALIGARRRDDDGMFLARQADGKAELRPAEHDRMVIGVLYPVPHGQLRAVECRGCHGRAYLSFCADAREDQWRQSSKRVACPRPGCSRKNSRSLRCLTRWRGSSCRGQKAHLPAWNRPRTNASSKAAAATSHRPRIAARIAMATRPTGTSGALMTSGRSERRAPGGAGPTGPSPYQGRPHVPAGGRSCRRRPGR